tara:strand:+ start:1141 stop:1653 length:513 start_codon:yes stop_codon:yes gene_type:complete
MSNNILTNDQRLNLQEMIKANDSEDCTEIIRNNKQSKLIKTDVNHFIFLKQKYNRLQESNPEEFDRICTSQCQFLFNNYTDIFNKIKKDLIDLKILNQFLDILKKIEDSDIDQHEGSYLVGSLLKQIYIDSALKREQQLDKKNKSTKSNKKIKEPKNISYSQYKVLQENK